MMAERYCKDCKNLLYCIHQYQRLYRTIIVFRVYKVSGVFAFRHFFVAWYLMV